MILSAYRIAFPSEFLAARPIVCISERSERKNPSLSASSIATSETSGRSSPSRSRLMPTSTSKTPRRRSRRILMRSSVKISLCRYVTFTPTSIKYSLRLSDIFFVNVVIKTRSLRSARTRHSSNRSSICPFTGRTSMTGSSKPVGRMICSITSPWVLFNSYGPGVAET